jgi:hypothetical protein
MVTIANIEVHTSGGAEASGWRTLIGEPRQFDLIKLLGIEEVLGDAVLEAGNTSRFVSRSSRRSSLSRALRGYLQFPAVSCAW